MEYKGNFSTIFLISLEEISYLVCFRNFLIHIIVFKPKF